MVDNDHMTPIETMTLDISPELIKHLNSLARSLKWGRPGTFISWVLTYSVLGVSPDGIMDRVSDRSVGVSNG